MTLDLRRALIARLKDRSCLDVGAGRGSFLSLCLDAGCDVVHAFEPYPARAEDLKRRFGNDPRVRVHDYALGAEDGTSTLRVAADETGAVDVSVRSLSSLVDDGTVPAHIGLLHVGTRGGDLDVLKGLGRLRCEAAVARYWHEDPDVDGACPFTLT